MTPVLVLLFGFHPATAVGTDLLYASVTKSVGTVVHGKRETVDWHIVGGLAFGSVPASIVDSVRDEPDRGEERTCAFLLNLLLGSVLFLTALAVFFRPRILRWARPPLDATAGWRGSRTGRSSSASCWAYWSP